MNVLVRDALNVCMFVPIRCHLSNTLMDSISEIIIGIVFHTHYGGSACYMYYISVHYDS